MDQHIKYPWDAQAELTPVPAAPAKPASWGDAQPAAPPSPAYILAHIFEENEVTLLWGESPGAEGYIVHRGEDPKSVRPIAPTKDATFTDNSVQPGNTYYYAVHAYNAHGQSKPGDCATVMLPEPRDAKAPQSKPLPGQFQAIPPSPAAAAAAPSPPTARPGAGLPLPPNNLRASTQGTRFVQLLWQAPQPDVEFRLYRSETPWSCYGLIAETSNTYYLDRVPEAATKYYYFVQSVQSGRASQASPMVEALTFPALPPPETPQGLRTEPRGIDSIELRWNHTRAAAAYVIYARITPNEDFCIIGHSLDCGWLHEGLPPDSLVDYRVQAYHDSGASPLSAVCAGRSAAPRGRPVPPAPRRPLFSPQAFQR